MCQYRGHRLNPWAGKMPYAAQHQPLTPSYLEPELPNKRSHHNEKPALHDSRKPTSSNEHPARPGEKKKKKTHQIKTCTPMFTAVLFTTAKLVHLCGSNHSTHQWRNTMRHLHAIEYCSALKRNEILICATSLVNFEITTLSEINQTRKDKCCMTPPPWGT